MGQGLVIGGNCTGIAKGSQDLSGIKAVTGRMTQGAGASVVAAAAMRLRIILN